MQKITIDVKSVSSELAILDLLGEINPYAASDLWDKEKDEVKDEYRDRYEDIYEFYFDFFMEKQLNS